MVDSVLPPALGWRISASLYQHCYIIKRRELVLYVCNRPLVGALTLAVCMHYQGEKMLLL